MGKDLNYAMLLDCYGDLLTDKQRDIMQLYYYEDLSLSEIAENEGITRQGVSDNIRRAESKMKLWEEDAGFCENFVRLKELALIAQKGDKTAIKEMINIIDNL